MAKQEQAGLPGIPQAPKRRIIEAIEDLCLDRDKLAGKRTALSDKIAEMGKEIQDKLDEHKLEVYTYEDANGVLQDVQNERTLKKRKSKLNPKKGKEKSE
jgi:hypothetical protein